jgi:hypothetical protein
MLLPLVDVNASPVPVHQGRSVPPDAIGLSRWCAPCADTPNLRHSEVGIAPSARRRTALRFWFGSDDANDCTPANPSSSPVELQSSRDAKVAAKTERLGGGRATTAASRQCFGRVSSRSGPASPLVNVTCIELHPRACRRRSRREVDIGKTDPSSRRTVLPPWQERCTCRRWR